MALGSKEKAKIVHRPGPLKQSNKVHKGGNGRGGKNERGKMDVKAISHKHKKEQNRLDRRHKASQLRKNKRDAILQKKRGFGTLDVPPILVAIISPHLSMDSNDFLNRIKSCDESITVSSSEQGHCHISFPRQKQRFTFFIPKFTDMHSVMDAAKVADVLLFLHAQENFDQYAEKLLSAILTHACPSTVHILQGLHQLNPKKKAELKKQISKKIESRFSGEKLYHADTNQELQLLLRQIGCQKQLSVAFRDARSNLLAEKVEFVPNEENDSTGTLLVTGYIRSQPLDVNKLVYVPGWDNYQVSKIECKNDRHPLNRNRAGKDSDMQDIEEEILCVEKADPSLQETLVSEVTPNPLEGEQTWPTEEELEEAEETIVQKKRIIEGTSDYQSAWIIDSDGDETDSESEASDSEDMITANDLSDNDDDAMQSEHSEEEDCTSVEDVEGGKVSNYDENVDMEEEKKMLVRFREERMEQMFPDEQDTPMDVPARVRYQKYRGLKNFAESPWDPMENLPLDYAKIYRFENFKQTKRKVMSGEREGLLPGYYVTIYISNVPRALYDDVKSSTSLVVYSLLPHEQKMSVMNVVIKKHSSCEVPIKSKDTLIFHIGFRRFECQPIFSVHSSRSKFKYERFLPSGTSVVASFYAPTTFPSASVVVFQQESNGNHALVATGSLLNIDPNRLVIKRIVLSGHPFRIFTRSAIVRYMFFNPEDINWFKCIELRTKCGRRGHIKETLGSQGHMKCIFDRQLQSQDIALLSLFKRVFPKWNYNPNVPTPVAPNENLEEMFT